MRVGAGGHEVVLDALYERKRDKKSVRVLTVLIYVFSVSLAAIMLSLYYVFFWEPKDTHQRKVSDNVERQATTPLPTCLMPHTGRSHACLLTFQHNIGALHSLLKVSLENLVKSSNKYNLTKNRTLFNTFPPQTLRWVLFCSVLEFHYTCEGTKLEIVYFY